MDAYYMVSDQDLIKEMQINLVKSYAAMAKAVTPDDFKKVYDNAPSFVFNKTSDYLEAIKADVIAVIVQPDKYYEFEILFHEPSKNRIAINSISFRRITIETFTEILMDYFPLDLSM